MIRWISLLVLFACEESTADPGEVPASTNPTAITLTDAHRSTLDAADLHDGLADQLIAECSGCSMAMSGDATHSSQVGEYTLHFCAASCKAGFDANPEQGIAHIATTLAAEE